MIPFFDRNFGTRVPKAIRLVGREIHFHDEHLHQTAPDVEVIRTIAAQNWVLFTRDKRLRNRIAEVDAIRREKAKCVVLAQRASMTAWALLQRVVCSWEEIETQADARTGPFILSVYKDGRLVRRDL